MASDSTDMLAIATRSKTVVVAPERGWVSEVALLNELRAAFPQERVDFSLQGS